MKMFRTESLNLEVTETKGILDLQSGQNLTPGSSLQDDGFVPCNRHLRKDASVNSCFNTNPHLAQEEQRLPRDI